MKLLLIAHSLRTDYCLVAIAYVMQKAPYVFPIIGGRKVEHLMSNIEALDITLTPEQIAYIESVTPAPRGFPHDFIVRDSSFALSRSALTRFICVTG